MTVKTLIEKITLTAFRNGPLLILYWSQAQTLPTRFKIVLNSAVDIPKPYLGIALGGAGNRMLCIALADAVTLSARVAVAIMNPDDPVKLASTRKSALSTLGSKPLSFLSPADRLRISRAINKGLRSAFPSLDAGMVDDLLRRVALTDVSGFTTGDWIYLQLPGADEGPLRTVQGTARMLAAGDGDSPATVQQPFLAGAGQVHALIPAAWMAGEPAGVLLTAGRWAASVMVQRKSLVPLNPATLADLLTGAAESAELLSDFLAARLLPARIEWLQVFSGNIVIGWLPGLTAPTDLEPFTVQLRQTGSALIAHWQRSIRVAGLDCGMLILFAWPTPTLQSQPVQVEYLRDGQWRFAQTSPTAGSLTQRLAALHPGPELALQFWELAQDEALPLSADLAAWLEPARQHCMAKLGRIARRPACARQQVGLELVLEHCGWLPGVGLLLSGYLIAPPGRVQRLTLHLPARRIDLGDYWTRTVRPDIEPNDLWAGYAVEEKPGFEVFLPLDENLAVLEAGYLAVECGQDQVARVALRPVINLAASRDMLDGAQALRLLEGFGPQLAARSRDWLKPLLTVLGDWLRQTQSGLHIRQGQTATEGVHLFVDNLLALSKQHLYLSGWLVDMQQHIAAIDLFTAFGDRADLTGQLPHSARPDLMQSLRKEGLTLINEFIGFHLRVDLPLAQGANTPVYLRIRLHNGAIHRLPLSFRRYNADQPLPLIRDLLGGFPTWEPRLFEFYDRAVGPTVSQLWQNRTPPHLELRQETFGIIPRAPQVSIIVPLYGRIDLLSFQLAQFANDPDFQQCELIYVLDDPSLYSAFVSLCRREYPLFQVPFHTVISGANLGYAGATNLGAAQAQGEYLLLLNSDVFPKEPGWLMRMVTVFETLDRPGVLGPKLLLADGLIQHAGMTFFQEPTLPGFWFNDHPEKGLPDDSAADTDSRQVAAVTGACMLLRREVYQAVGGLSEDYILGDFEDSDLCLKLRTAGYRIWYAPHIALYHLERLSFPHAGDGAWRTNLSRYNAWVQTKRWGEVIRVMCENTAMLPGQK